MLDKSFLKNPDKRNPVEKYLDAADAVSERLSRAEYLEKKMGYDHLTGAKDKMRLQGELDTLNASRGEKGIDRREKTDHTWLLFLDLDGFKKINDESGHDIGDGTLVEFVQVLKQSLRTSDADHIFRRSGDEFVVILENMHSQQDVLYVADRVRKAVEQRFKTGETVNGTVLLSPVTVSIGAVNSIQKHYDHYGVEVLADAVMYSAKNNTSIRDDILIDPAVASSGQSKNRVCYMDESGTIRLYVPEHFPDTVSKAA